VLAILWLRVVAVVEQTVQLQVSVAAVGLVGIERQQVYL